MKSDIHEMADFAEWIHKHAVMLDQGQWYISGYELPLDSEQLVRKYLSERNLRRLLESNGRKYFGTRKSEQYELAVWYILIICMVLALFIPNK